MKRVLLVIAALLSLTVLLAACKKSGDTISTPTAESTPATVEAKKGSHFFSSFLATLPAYWRR